MKKILLIIAIIFCIFQVVVLATAIDIGNTAEIRGLSQAFPFTLVDTVNPANASGSITQVSIYAYNTLYNVEVATFFVVSGKNLTTRDNEAIGTVNSGSKRDFSVNLNVEEGDYIGIYATSGYIYYDATGSMLYSTGDRIPCENHTFSGPAAYTLSLHGTGTTTEEEANAILFGTNF